MDKVEIMKLLTTSGQITVFRRTPEWEKAFKLYNDIHKTSKNPNCGSCFREVLAWLRS